MHPFHLKKYKTMFLIVLAVFCVLAATIATCNILVSSYGVYTRDSIDSLPEVHAALVLGTSKWLPGGRENLYYLNRIEAAAEVYHAGKCRKLVVSGDNRKNNYNEPLLMQEDLLRRGVKQEDIICDFAGLRTLDSVIRFKKVFGQNSGIVISQKFHNSRAIYVARHNGMNLLGYNAADVSRYSGIKTKLRELFSKLFCVLDVHILDTQPRHLGDPVQV